MATGDVLTWTPIESVDAEWASVGTFGESLTWTQMPAADAPRTLVVRGDDGDLTYTLPNGVWTAGVEDGRCVVRVDGEEVEPDADR